MNLSEKLKHLRAVEGELRGLNRPMTQVEVVNAMQEELDASLSQAYLSQLERGKRVHLTASSRDLLAEFFKVHPGYLVSDPPDYNTDLMTDMIEIESTADRLETWLTASAEEWRNDPAVSLFFKRLAQVEDPRHYLSHFERLLSLSAEQLETLVNALLPSDAHDGYRVKYSSIGE
jgi:transcriptional regulator with XRE-family HTH domain